MEGFEVPPLTHAIFCENEAESKTLIDDPLTDVNTPTKRLNSATTKPKINFDGWTPLHMAVWKSQRNTVQMLLEKKHLRVHTKNTDGVTALEMSKDREITLFIEEHITILNTINTACVLDTNSFIESNIDDISYLLFSPYCRKTFIPWIVLEELDILDKKQKDGSSGKKKVKSIMYLLESTHNHGNPLEGSNICMQNYESVKKPSADNSIIDFAVEKAKELDVGVVFISKDRLCRLKAHTSKKLKVCDSISRYIEEHVEDKMRTVRDFLKQKANDAKVLLMVEYKDKMYPIGVSPDNTLWELKRMLEDMTRKHGCWVSAEYQVLTRMGKKLNEPKKRIKTFDFEQNEVIVLKKKY